LIILADSKEAGVFLIMNQNGSQIFITGHPEYDRLTLDKEYKRDLAAGMIIDKPVNYYGKDRKNRPLLTWRAHSNALYSNWINYYVYQQTPYEW
jgi:homoserine O-succinyltransferase